MIWTLHDIVCTSLVVALMLDGAAARASDGPAPTAEQKAPTPEPAPTPTPTTIEAWQAYAERGANEAHVAANRAEASRWERKACRHSSRAMARSKKQQAADAKGRHRRSHRHALATSRAWLAALGYWLMLDSDDELVPTCTLPAAASSPVDAALRSTPAAGSTPAAPAPSPP